MFYVPLRMPWEKVQAFPSGPWCIARKTPRALANLTNLDVCPPLFRIHLPRYHVISVFILGPWPCAWSHLDRCPSSFRSVHLPYCLVRQTVGCLALIF